VGVLPSPPGLGRFLTLATPVPEFRVCVSIMLEATNGYAESIEAQLALERQPWSGCPLLLGDVAFRGMYLLETRAASGASSYETHTSVLLLSMSVEQPEGQEQHTLVSACARLALDARCRHRHVVFVVRGMVLVINGGSHVHSRSFRHWGLATGNRRPRRQRILHYHSLVLCICLILVCWSDPCPLASDVVAMVVLDFQST